MSEKSDNTLKLRVLSAVVLAPLVLAAIAVGGWVYLGLLSVLGVLLVLEWTKMVQGRLAWVAFGAVYVAASCAALWVLRQDQAWGLTVLFWLVAVVWGADTGGYVFGKSIGGPKLAPAISPNKTWSGFLGGTALSAVGGWAVVFVMADGAGLGVAVFSAATGVVSQVGDLFESWVKRRFGVKDSGAIIPGHGGVFDRVDGLVAAAIGVVLMNMALQGNVLAWLA
ncbi:MAG: phosphatidate cytidylyltransferase [Alphaproteobacteria bacterium]|nr:phosphatidate cytidylyltransferase [Alphaproteobacteria bacterium]MBF0249479.1 phosphatidate cytidylyltransferase [Alphaproteobacteria bacterium]